MKLFKKFILALILPVFMLMALVGCAGGMPVETSYSFLINNVVMTGDKLFDARNKIAKDTITKYKVDDVEYVHTIAEEYVPAYGYIRIETLSNNFTKEEVIVSADIYRTYTPYLESTTTPCGHYTFSHYDETTDLPMYYFDKYTLDDINGLYLTDGLFYNILHNIYNPVKSVIYDNKDKLDESIMIDGSYSNGTSTYLLYELDGIQYTLKTSRIELMTDLFKTKYYPVQLIETNKAAGTKTTYNWDAQAFDLPGVVADPFASVYPTAEQVIIIDNEETEIPETPQEPVTPETPVLPPVNENVTDEEDPEQQDDNEA